LVVLSLFVRTRAEEELVSEITYCVSSGTLTF